MGEAIKNVEESQTHLDFRQVPKRRNDRVGAKQPGDRKQELTKEVEHRFFNFKEHGHLIKQFPTVICWDINQKPRLPVKQTAKRYKHVVQLSETTLRIYTLKDMPGVSVATVEDMQRKGADKAWASNL